MQASVVEIAQLLAAVGTFSAVGWFTNRRMNSRKEIRKALVSFNTMVDAIAGGDWAGIAHPEMTPEQLQQVQSGWGERRQRVAIHRKQVQDIIDTDRFSPGPRWCKDVEQCIRLGYELTHHIIGMNTLPGIDHEKWNREFEEKRETYQAAYRRLTGSA